MLLSRFFLACVLALSLTVTGCSEEAPRVFVCAHSFMIFTAKWLPQIAASAKVPFVSAGQQMIGGSRVIQHWNLPADQNRAKAALEAGQVDVLTLSPHLALPDPGIDHFVQLGLEKNPHLRIYVQASWPPNDGVLSGPFRNEDRDRLTVEKLENLRTTFSSLWLEKLEQQISTLNARIGHTAVYIVPAGAAVFALREKVAAGEVPAVKTQSELFRDPLGHPQPILQALVSYCHFAAIYRRSPVGLPVPDAYRDVPGIGDLARTLQQIAWEVVSGYAPSGVNAASASAK